MLFMSSVNSTKNRYSKEQKQQRSRVLTAQRTKTTILNSITMRSTTNHSWLPQDLVTCLHARQSWTSSSWIGHKPCVPLDSSWLDMLFFPLRGLPFHRLLCLLQPLFVSGIICQFAFSHHASPQLQLVHTTYELLPLSNQLPTPIQGLLDLVECWQRIWSRQVSLRLHKCLVEASVARMTTRGCKWATNRLTHGFLGHYQKYP